MSSMLRSLKFVRNLGFAVGPRRLSSPSRYLGWPTVTGTKLQPECCACMSTLQQRENYVTSVAPKLEASRARNHAEFVFRDVDRQLNKYGKIYKEQIDDLLRAVYSAGTLSSSQALFLLRCCGSFLTIESLLSRRAITENVWETIKEYGTQIDISHYNAYILANLENETDFSPVDILLEMKEKNIEPNRVTFQRFIEQYCSKGDIPGATKILEHMSELGLPLNETIFNSLIKGHSESGDLQSALNILDIMKKAGIEPTSKTYTAVICAYAKRGDAESMQETLKECQSKDLLLTDGEIFEVIYSLGTNNHSDLVDEMLNISPKGRSYVKEAITCIHRLIDSNQEDVALKIQSSLEETVEPGRNQAYYFIRKLVLSSKDVDKIAKYCNTLGKESAKDLFSAAVHIALTNNLQKLALPLFKHWKEAGGEIREHFFVPIFISCIKDNNLQGILDTLKAMVLEYKITPQVSVLKKYVVPYMVDNPEQNVAILLNHGVNMRLSHTAVASHLMSEGKSRLADTLITSRNILCNLNVLTTSLANCLAITKDVESFLNIIHHQFLLLNNDESSVTKDVLTEDDKRMKAPQLSGVALLKAIDELSTKNENCVQEILKNFVARGMRVDPEIAEKITMNLKNGGFDSSLCELVSKLTSPDLSTQPSIRNSLLSKPVSKYKSRPSSSDSTENKMGLILHHARAHNTDKFEELLKEFEEEKPVYTSGFCCSVMSYYSRSKNIQEVDRWYNRLNDIEPRFPLEKAIILNYVDLLISHNRLDDAFRVLNRPILDDDTDRYQLCSKVLWNVERNHPGQIEQVFDILESRKFFKTYDRHIIAPLIKGPLDVNNIDQALKRLEWASKKIQCVPHLGTVLNKLIMNEDTKNLQYVTDLSTKIIGETNALMNLACALIECNKPRQARKILETKGLNITIQRIMQFARYFKKQSKLDVLERLYLATSQLLPNMDYFHRLMLETYEEQGDWEKCLSLWTKMQEDNIQPSPRFMYQLEKILVAAKQEVPFVSSEMIAEDDPESAAEKILTKEELNQLKAKLAGLSLTERSVAYKRMIDYYLELKDMQNASKYMKELITARVFNLSVQYHLPPIMTKLVDLDQFDMILKAVIDMSDPINKYNNHTRHKVKHFINKRYLELGKYEKLLSEFENFLLDSKKDKIFPYLFDTKVGVEALVNCPEIEKCFEEFAIKASQAQLLGPMNSLWLYYFLKENPKAKDIWDNVLNNGAYLQSIDVIKTCKNLGALEKMPLIAEAISTSYLSIQHKAKCFEFMLRVLVIWDDPNRYQIAYKCMEYIRKSVDINALDSNLLASIEEQLTTDR